MARSQNGPRKPATKFPHLRKQMQKNALPTQPPATQFGQLNQFGKPKGKLPKRPPQQP